MSESAITLENVSKRYHYGGNAPLSYNLRADITEWVLGTFRHGQSRHSTLHEVQEKHMAGSPEYFWALKDVNIEIRQGEVVGIIGRNGAGKSTLLKILSRITPPTTGKITYYGRVASLLEVGTGFHRELTGRENIFLNGSILGMKRSEIARRLDEIIAFAEVEKFIDTPVKFYSSGMYVRLAFAVAAHLEPEILLVDEVLAVGDATFQKKCLGKMEDVARTGRTVLFVSHNMSAILSLCSTGYLLDHGLVAARGRIQDVVEKYIQTTTSAAAIPLRERTDRKGTGRVRLNSLTIESRNGSAAIRCGDALRIKLDYTAHQKLVAAAFLVGIYDQFDRPIFFLDSRTAGNLPDVLPASGSVTCETAPVNLTPGPCVVNVAALIGSDIMDHITNACTLEIAPDDFYGSGRMTDRQTALCLLRQDWRLQS
jgi:lipopolysaccharide transport system ATP-binding protein